MSTAASGGRTCLFCGGGPPWSDEHITPAWLLRHLELPDDDQIFLGAATAETGEIVRSRTHSTFRFVEGRVCWGCNTGWMHRLEDAARPVLVPLIDRTRELQSLTADEAELVGKWAIKTAYLHTYAGVLRQPVPRGHIAALNGDAGRPVATVEVFGMQSEYHRPSAYLQYGVWFEATNVDVRGLEPPEDSYKIVVQYRHLYLLVAHWPPPAQFIRSDAMHVRVLPRRDADLIWEINLTPVADGPIGRLQAFAVGLGVRHETRRLGPRP
jgi:hypothetical protein